MGQTERILSVDSKNAISEALNQSISELVVTTMMAQNFHWNVTGMAFGPLHELFQTKFRPGLLAPLCQLLCPSLLSAVR